jgi:hypothetical protein
MDTIIFLSTISLSCYLSFTQTEQILRYAGFVNHNKGDIPPSIWLSLPLFFLYSGTGYSLYILYKNYKKN